MDCVLKDLIDVSKDGEWGKGEPSEESVEMLCIRGTDFDDVRFGNTGSTPHRHIERRIAERKKLQPWDVLIEAAGGTKSQITGRTVLLRPNLFSCSAVPITCASFSRFIRFKTDLCDPQFMFWYLQHLYHSGFMHPYHTQHTGVARFQWTTFSERESLHIPPIQVQRRIAGILSAYDELIENNQRRIKILEEMARSLYREWFVHFRFSGHDKVKMVPSPLGPIPQGWEVKPLQAVCTRITDGAHQSPPSVADGYPMASVKDMHDWGINVESCRRISEGDYQNLVRNNCKPLKNDVLIAKDGSYLKHTFVVGEEQDLVILSSIAMLRPNSAIHPNFLSFTLRDPATKARMTGFVSGVAVPRIILKDFRNFQILVPPADIQVAWTKHVDPKVDLCRVLISQTQNLRRTRDLLLPRLLRKNFTS